MERAQDRRIGGRGRSAAAELAVERAADRHALAVRVDEREGVAVGHAHGRAVGDLRAAGEADIGRIADDDRLGRRCAGQAQRQRQGRCGDPETMHGGKSITSRLPPQRHFRVPGDCAGPRGRILSARHEPAPRLRARRRPRILRPARSTHGRVQRPCHDRQRARDRRLAARARRRMGIAEHGRQGGAARGRAPAPRVDPAQEPAAIADQGRPRGDHPLPLRQRRHGHAASRRADRRREMPLRRPDLHDDANRRSPCRCPMRRCARMS